MQPSVDDELAGTEKPNRLLARTWYQFLRRVQQKINRTQRNLMEGSGKEESSVLLSSIRSANSGEAGQGTVTGGSDVN